MKVLEKLLSCLAARLNCSTHSFRAIDRILNMARVIPNIVGDAAAAVVVAKSEGELHPGLVKETAND